MQMFTMFRFAFTGNILSKRLHNIVFSEACNIAIISHNYRCKVIPRTPDVLSVICDRLVTMLLVLFAECEWCY
jgi:hypothetical protein